MDQTPPMPGPAPSIAAPPPAPLPAAVPRPRRTPRGTAWMLRVTLTLLAIACIAQPLLIGRYLDGDFDAIGLHSGNSSLVAFMVMAAGAASLLWAVRGGHPGPLLALVVMFFAVGLQIGMGFSRNLTIHIPLGVAIVAVSMVLAGWSWTGRVFRGRR